MNRKILSVVLAVLLAGCGAGKPEESDRPQTTNGPVVPEDETTDEEKMLRMLQECVADYNEGRIEEQEAYFQLAIPRLPLELTTLPEITSLDQLTPLEEAYSNAVMIGELPVDDRYSAVFRIFRPSNGSFWANGEIEFRIDPDDVVRNDPQFTEYRQALETLLPNGTAALNYLHGVDITLGEESEDGFYYPVISVGSTGIRSVAELQAYAEQYYAKDYLERYYYPNAFYTTQPIFREEGGQLYCLATDVTFAFYSQYEPSTIIAAKEENGLVTLNMLTSVMGNLQPEIKEVRIQRTENGFVLPNQPQ